MARDIPNTNEITSFIHCLQCLEEWKAHPEWELSPKQYAATGVGFTSLGLQVWCNRHECNICHIDFEGAQHPANEERPR